MTTQESHNPDSAESTGKLYVTATPIGNLEDLSARGKRVLVEVGLIVCEDTRRTKKLLSHFDIHTPTESYHGDSSDKKRERIIRKLQSGDDVALVSDAGTPGVSDPGMRLVRSAREGGVGVVSIPGPSAITAALSVSGLRGHAFTFLGYAPRKNKKGFINRIENLAHTAIFFESVHRIEDTLEKFADNLAADRDVVVCRELTKQFESVVTGSAKEVKKYFFNHQDEVRGEFVILVSNG
jgi:16S rRNA (cytidine1402-2'-O)-methyltransferase